MSRLAKALVSRPFTTGGGWTPASMPTLKVWYKTPIGVFTDGASLTGASWSDSSGNGNTGTITGPSATYHTNIKNGHAVLRSDDGGTWVTTPSTIDYSAGYGVYLILSAAFESEFGVGSCPLDGVAIDDRYYAGGTRLAGDHAYVHTASIGGPPMGGTWHVCWLECDTMSISVGVDTAVGAPSTPAGPLILAGTNPASYSFLRHSAGNAWWGYFGEGLLCTPAPSVGDHNLLITYLKTYWAIP